MYRNFYKLTKIMNLYIIQNIQITIIYIYNVIVFTRENILKTFI